MVFRPEKVKPVGGGSSQIESYRDLRVWQKGMDLTERVYELTRAFPSDEKFGLTSQLRRAAVSVPSNIAEGWGRNSTGSFVRYLRIAHGSLAEIETQIEIAHRLEYISERERDAFLKETTAERKMILAFVRSLNKRSQ